MEPKLQNQQALIDTLFTHLPIGIVTLGINGKFLHANPYFTKITGYTLDDIPCIDDWFSKAYPDLEYRKNVIREWNRSSEHESVIKEFDVTCKDSQIKTIKFHGLFLPDGKILVTLTDISDQKTAENTLKSIFKAAPTGIGMVCNRIIVQANDKLCHMVGYARQELIGQPSRILYPSKKDFDYVGEKKYRQIKEKGTGTVETRWHHKNGHTIDVLLSSTPIDQKDWSKGVTFTALDITRRIQMENSLKKSEALYREYFEEILSGASITSLTGDLLECNQEFLRIFGFSSKADARRRSVAHLYKTPGRRDEFIEQILKNKGVKYFESQMKKKDGTLLHVIENAVGVFDKNGKLTKIRGYLVDISDLKNMEIQLRQSQKMEALGTLVGGISHDFNNILQAILGYAELLAMDKQEGDPDYSNIHALSRVCTRACDLVQQLLVFSRKAPTKKKPLDINVEIEHARSLLEKTIPKMISIETRLFSEIWPILADPLQMEQIFLNLGSNASDAMPDGGQITMETKNIHVPEAPPHRSIGLTPGHYVLIRILDTGCGMKKSTVEKIFEPFFTTKEKGKGTGLGLASVYGIVTHHDGRITCKSEPGHGTVFNIYLPALEHKTIKPRFETRLKFKRGRETILLVDDEAAIRNFASIALNRMGYQCMEAISGEAAIDIYSNDPSKINLVILDLSMPGMGGYKCLEHLIAINPKIKIIVASGYSADTTIQDCLNAGAADYIKKPYRIADLSARVRNLFDSASTDG